MDITAMQTWRICNLLFLLQVKKIKNDAMWAQRIWELLLLLQVSKLKMTPILHSANHQQHLSGHMFLLLFPNSDVRWLWIMLPLAQSGALRG